MISNKKLLSLFKESKHLFKALGLFLLGIITDNLITDIFGWDKTGYVLYFIITIK
jgi:hypothetical protein